MLAAFEKYVSIIDPENRILKEERRGARPAARPSLNHRSGE